MNRGGFMKNQIAFVWVFVSVCCLFVIIVTFIRLPEPSSGYSSMDYLILQKIRKVPDDGGIGKFGELMVLMLPEDLAFTIFLPSEKAFESDLMLRVSDSLGAEKVNDTYAILSRVLGFSVVPRKISSIAVPFGEEINHDSLSGFNLFISKDLNGMLIVNRIRSERVDIQKGKIVIHVMNGVLMDADFEQSVKPDDVED